MTPTPNPSAHPGEGRDPDGGRLGGVEDRSVLPANSVAPAGSRPSPGRAAEDDIWAVLRDVPDPEIPAVSVVDLGMVRRANAHEVALTPTYTGCPATLVIEQSVRQALDAAGYTDIAVVTELDPPWSTDWISDEGREKLRAYGISPPPQGADRASLNAKAAQCPQCGSFHTEEISRFGSTPCKSLWRCKDCAEPFDRFKCL